MNALHIALKDLSIILRDRSHLMNLVALPTIFVVVLSSAMQGWMGVPTDSRVHLTVTNLDAGSSASEDLVAALGEAGGLRVELASDPAGAEQRLREFSIGRLLVIPAGYGEDLAAGRPATLRHIVHPDVSPTTTESVQRVLEGIVLEVGISTAIERMVATSTEGALVPPAGMVGHADPAVWVDEVRRQIGEARNHPLVTVVQALPEALDERAREPNAVEQNVPGYAIIFGFLTAQATAASLYREKRTGTFRRLLASPTTRAQLLGGKMLLNLLLALLQIGVVFAVGVFVLPRLGLQRLSLGHTPLALLPVSVALALAATGLGLCIAALARTPAQVGGLSTLLLWTGGAVGGCLFPPFLLGGPIGSIGRAVPHYWAITAYQDLIVRGRGLADVLPSLGVLLAFALAFSLVGIWRFRFE